jgi:hypothetical protein
MFMGSVGTFKRADLKLPRSTSTRQRAFDFNVLNNFSETLFAYSAAAAAANSFLK